MELYCEPALFNTLIKTEYGTTTGMDRLGEHGPSMGPCLSPPLTELTITGHVQKPRTERKPR